MPAITIAAFFIAVSVFIILVASLVVTFKNNLSKQIAIRQSSDFLLQVAYEDDITGLRTMAKFTMDVAPIFASARPSEYTLIILDIDNFKYINDIFGYKTGNRVLRYLARYLEGIMPTGTLLSRINADNFIILCPSHLLEETCALISDYRVQNYFPEIGHMLGDSFRMSFSMGSYPVTDPNRELAVMMDYAMIAKKQVKDTYGTTHARYTESMDLDIQLKSKITVVMEGALAADEFMAYFQPQYSLEDGSLVGAEVLTRWHSTTIGTVFPSEFIPLFEKNGFIRKLDLYILERSCKLIRIWLDSGITTVPRISVNASRMTILYDGYLDSLLDITERYRIDHDMIEIELTESLLGDNPAQVLHIMHQLKAFGFHVSVDDFGKGYSSLTLLKDIPADVLKIDRGFITDAMDSQRGMDIVSSVVDMAKKLHLSTVAEGIETLEQAEGLRGMGCDIAQGFYFARPMPSSDFERTMREQMEADANADEQDDDLRDNVLTITPA